MGSLSITLGIVALFGIVVTIGMLIYVASNKPKNSEAARYAIAGLCLILASQFVGMIVGLISRLLDSIYMIIFVQNVGTYALGTFGVIALLKAVYVGSNGNPTPSPGRGPSESFATGPIADQRPPFSPAMPPPQQ